MTTVRFSDNCGSTIGWESISPYGNYEELVSDGSLLYYPMAKEADRTSRKYLFMENQVPGTVEFTFEANILIADPSGTPASYDQAGLGTNYFLIYYKPYTREFGISVASEDDEHFYLSDEYKETLSAGSHNLVVKIKKLIVAGTHYLNIYINDVLKKQIDSSPSVNAAGLSQIVFRDLHIFSTTFPPKWFAIDYITLDWEFIPLISCDLDKNDVALYVGDTETITPALNPPDAYTTKAATLVSADESIATISGSTITAVSVGQTTITATAYTVNPVTGDEVTKTSTCQITVLPPGGRNTRKRYALIEECLSSDPSATINYNGKWYKFVRYLEEFAATIHSAAGVAVEYSNGGETIEYGAITYLYLISGVSDPEAEGGYGSFKKGNSRYIKSSDAGESSVNFYYYEPIAADMAITFPTEIKSANPTIIFEAGFSQPAGVKYHYKISSYADSEGATLISATDSSVNPELFKYSIDGGLSWLAFPATGVANENAKALISCKVLVGPRNEVWIMPSKQAVI